MHTNNLIHLREKMYYYLRSFLHLLCKSRILAYINCESREIKSTKLKEGRYIIHVEYFIWFENNMLLLIFYEKVTA